MIFEVEMHAFGKGAIRDVNVPEQEIQKHLPLSRVDDGQLTDRKQAILDLIFHYGQNDFQSKPLPSVSVGDIIRFGFSKTLFQERWAVMAIGFKLVPADFVPPQNGGIWAYSL